MVKKEIKKHSFLKEESILLWGNQTYIVNGDDIVTIGINNHVTAENYVLGTINPHIRLDNTMGDSIFVVNENEIVWRGQTLVTEERVREIVEEQMRELGFI